MNVIFFPILLRGHNVCTSFAPLGCFPLVHIVLCDQSFLIREDVSEPSPVPCQSSHDCPSSVRVSPSSVRVSPSSVRVSPSSVCLGLSHLPGSSLEPLDPSEANQDLAPKPVVVVHARMTLLPRMTAQLSALHALRRLGSLFPAFLTSFFHPRLPSLLSV